MSKVCDLAIASAKAALDNTIACAGALGATPENGPVIQRTCPAPVRAALTERDVARRERANALGELALERAGRSAAIQRAASAAQLQAERKARAEAAVQRAPRDGSGRVVCDADCMRERWGQAVAGQ